MKASVQGEVVLLNTRTGQYFGLNVVGAWLWEHISSPITFGELVAKVVEKYEVDLEQAEHDINAVVGSLHDAGLIETTG